MQVGGWGKRRGFAIAGIALMLLIIVPEMTPAVGATGSPGISAATEHDATPARLVAKRKRRGNFAAALAKYFAAHPKALTSALRKKALAARAATTKATRSTATKTPAQRRAAQRKAAARAKARRTAAARRALARKKAGALKTKPIAKRGASSLSLPLLGLLAIAPFLLMSIYLLGTDHVRRRPPRKRHASLVITRVSDR